MKKLLALLLSFMLLWGAASGLAEETAAEAEGADRYEQLTVATGTPFSGNFFSEVLGNNLSDQDIRKLIHGYNLVEWNSADGAFRINQHLFSSVIASDNDATFLFDLKEGLTYSDGTPITARDYAFSMLLQSSGQLQKTAGNRLNVSRLLGGKAYHDGETNALAGLRVFSDYQFSLTLDPAYTPYFYQLKALDLSPMPVSVIAPGCEVKDDGQGAYIDGPFTGELLQQTLLDPAAGYMSHPSVTCGPYRLTAFDGSRVTLELNEAYQGDAEGNLPTIPKIIVRAENPNEVMDLLATGQVDLVVRCVRESQIRNGMELVGAGSYAMKAYSRAGLSFISFCAEKGPTADVNVRKALAMCLDREELATQYTGAYGTVVNGYYGIGQWMFMMANGTLIPEEGAEGEWADLTLERIPVYSLNHAQAVNLLESAGWNLNEDGEAYDAQAGGVRCKLIDGEIVPLRLKIIYSEGNGASTLLRTVFTPYLSKAGVELQIQKLPAQEVFETYYGQRERDCDMILLGTNFGDIFDPSGDFDADGKDALNGVTDPHLAELAVAMRETEPGNAPEYCRRWLAFQEYRAEIVPEIPLYSNAYLDFHIVELQNYEPGSTGSWAAAIPKAILSDYAPPAEEEEEPADGSFEEV